MHLLDWAIVIAYIAWLVSDGLRRTTRERTTESYFLANRSMPWWAVGLSVMATQLSAITLVGTTGQGYNDGLRFVQFYYGLPLAMIILCVTLVPFFYRAKVYTAYEYLERRFDLKTRVSHELSVPAFARHVLRRHRGRAGRGSVGDPRVERDDDRAPHPRSGRHLHDARRRAGGHLDRRQDNGTHGRDADCRDDLSGQGSARRGERRRRVDDCRRYRPPPGIQFRLHPHGNLHVLVGPARRAVSDALVLRLRSEPGAALPDGQVG